MIFNLIGLACLVHILVDFISSFDLPELPNKPFRCELCMGFWLSILPLTIMYGATGLLAAPIVGVLADLIFRLKNRL